MKNKILFAIIIIGCILIGFFFGRYHNEYQRKCDFISEIVDWNTDGEELSVITKDGYEFYAYKSENVYDNIIY